MGGLRVGVLYGGFSNERDVSLRTGTAIFDALVSLGHRPVLIDVNDTLVDALSAADVEVCYNALHGSFGEDGLGMGWGWDLDLVLFDTVSFLSPMMMVLSFFTLSMAS